MTAPCIPYICTPVSTVTIPQTVTVPFVPAPTPVHVVAPSTAPRPIPAGLPITGADVIGLVVVGLVLLFIGLALVRQTRHSQG